MSLIDNLYTFLEEQEEKLFVPTCEDEMTEEEVQARFKINSKEQANYYLRKYKEIELAESEIDETALKELERFTKNINEWKEKELSKLQYPKQFFKALLEEFAKEQTTDAKRTLSLPNGSIGFKKQQSEYIYNDDILKNFLSQTEYVHREEVLKLDKKALKKDLVVVDGKAYIDGQEIPGVEVHQRDMKFDIK